MKTPYFNRLQRVSIYCGTLSGDWLLFILAWMKYWRSIYYKLFPGKKFRKPFKVRAATVAEIQKGYEGFGFGKEKTKKELKNLNFIYNRLVLVHEENPNYDYMIGLQAVIDNKNIELLIKEEEVKRLELLKIQK